MIKALVFDYGGVFTPNGRFRDIAQLYAAKSGVDPEKFLGVIGRNWRRARIGALPPKEFWQNVAAFVHYDPIVLRREWIAWFGFRKEMPPFVATLKKQYLIGLLTNNIDDWFDEVMKLYGLCPLFDVIVTSFHEGIAKPDPEIYLRTAQQLHVAPEECVFIDDQQKHVDGAIAVGMHGVRFQSLDQLRHDLGSLGVVI